MLNLICGIWTWLIPNNALWIQQIARNIKTLRYGCRRNLTY